MQYNSANEQQVLLELGVDAQTLSKFELFFAKLVQANQHINLTAIEDRQQVYIKHFADSILPQNYFSQNSTVLDVGCGAGFPSIPLAIIRPDLQFVCVDSVGKKIKFVEQVAKDLELANILAIHSRVEDIKIDLKSVLNGTADNSTNIDTETNRRLYSAFECGFDYGVARALAQMSTLAEYILPFIKISGTMLAYKSSAVDDELQQAKKAISILGGSVEQVVPMQLPTTDIVRKIVIIKKLNQTPPKYPRGQNKPKTQPL